jgi:hypothetical protein
MQAEKQAVKLDKPGAGLPMVEHFVVKYVLFPMHMRRFNWAQSLEMMQDEKNKIIAMTKALDDDAFNKKVLIKRLPGLEDSSRYWSCGMTIKHLEIVKKGLAGIASALAKNETPTLKADVAAVKPFDVFYSTDKTLAEFDQALNDIYARMRDLEAGAQNKAKAYHPFFGDIPCHGWIWLLGFHTRLHRQQIELILKGEKNA